MRVELRQGDLADLAFLRTDSVDVVFTAYAFGYVEDLGRVFRQVHRVLKVGAPLVFSLEHPAYALIDDDAEQPLLVRRSYFDRAADRPASRGGVELTAYHHTFADLYMGLIQASYRLEAILEPEPLLDGPRSSSGARPSATCRAPSSSRPAKRATDQSTDSGDGSARSASEPAATPSRLQSRTVCVRTVCVRTVCSRSGPPPPRRLGGVAVLGPPGVQPPAGLVLAEHALVEAQVEQEVEGPTDRRAGSMPRRSMTDGRRAQAGWRRAPRAARSSAMRTSSSSMRRASARALAALRVVESHRVSSFSWSSRGPASRT